MRESFRSVGLAGPGLLLVGVVALAIAPPVVAQEFESPPSVRAADVLPAELLEGPDHEVEDEVVSDGVALRFRIRSRFGEFEAPSREMAELRIAEMAAIARLADFESHEMFTEGLVDSVEKKAEAVTHFVKDPEATLRGAGKGLERLFGRGQKAVEDAAEAAKDGAGEKKPGKKASTADQVDELLGVNKAKRQLARSVGADPYSSNPALQKHLKRLAEAAVAGGFGGSLAFRVPGLDQVASVSRLAWDLPPEDLKARNQASLEAMGCDDETIEKLLGSAAFSPTLVTGLVGALQALGELQDRASLARLAAGAENEAEARFYRSSVSLLGAARSAGQSLRKALAYGRVPAALAADGTLVIAAAADLLIWQEGLAAAAERPVPEAKRRVLWLTGELSGRARAELRRRGFEIRERLTVE